MAISTVFSRSRMLKGIGAVLTLAILAGVVYLCIAEAATGTDDDAKNGTDSGDGGTASGTATITTIAPKEQLHNLREASGRAPEIDPNPAAETSTRTYSESDRASDERIALALIEVMKEKMRELDEIAARGPPQGVIPKKTKITLDGNATAPPHKCMGCPTFQLPRMCRLHQWKYLVEICNGRIYQYEGIQTFNDYWNDNNHEELLAYCCQNLCGLHQYAEMCENPYEPLGKPDPKLAEYWRRAEAKARALEEKARLEKEAREKNASTSTTAQP